MLGSQLAKTPFLRHNKISVGNVQTKTPPSRFCYAVIDVAFFEFSNLFFFSKARVSVDLASLLLESSRKLPNCRIESLLNIEWKRS